MSKRILKLAVKKEFFDMILSGFKLEEYREIKQHWDNYLIRSYGFKEYDYVEFTNGYGKKCPQITVEWKGTKKGLPQLKWCGTQFTSEIEELYVISLGNLISFNNLNIKQYEIARSRIGRD